ncbi:hypothetical protein MCEMAEM6B_02152 [Mycobacteriaceae bacterium]
MSNLDRRAVLLFGVIPREGELRRGQPRHTLTKQSNRHGPAREPSKTGGAASFPLHDETGAPAR